MATEMENPASEPDIENARDLMTKFKAAGEKLSQFVLAQDQVIARLLCVFLANGHGLIIGLPGLAKTRLVRCAALVMGIDWQRVQFTPDFMPSDILGSEVLTSQKDGSKGFSFLKGPIFTSLLMADEINRASPRTQSALLQAMAEYEVTIAGTDYPLARPFHVLATQNPIEQEGTFPLPEAQLDRFLMEINIGQPGRTDEILIVEQTQADAPINIDPLIGAADILAAQAFVQAMPVGPKLVEASVDLVRMLRPETTEIADIKDALRFGPGPRGPIFLVRAAKAHAFLAGRFTPSLEDVIAVADPVLRHRLGLNWGAGFGRASKSALIKQALDHVLAKG